MGGTVMDRVLGKRFEQIIRPFEGESPFGENVKYGERYETITREIQKLTGASSKEIRVDWKLVKETAIELLCEESKDLSIACFLTVALFLQDGYPGAGDGFDIVRKFLVDDWENIFPPVKRAARRANDLRWLVDRIAPLMEVRKAGETDTEVIDTLLQTVADISKRSREVLENKTPSYADIIKVLEHWQREFKKQELLQQGPTTEKSTTEDSQPPGTSTKAEENQKNVPSPESTGQTPPPALSTKEEPKVRDQPAPKPVQSPPPAVISEGASVSSLRGEMEVFIKPLRDADPLSPLPYKILRLLKWEGILGPAQGGKTRIPGPRSNEIAPLNAMLGAGNWKALLERSEGMFKSGQIWYLDLHRFSATALEHLDPRGEESLAAGAVKEATAALLERNPALLDCSFSSGLPFVSDETRSWLAEIGSKKGISLGVAPQAGGTPEKRVFDATELQEAVQALRKKKIAQGMDVLQQGIERAQDARSSFRARMDSARACLDAQQPGWAKPLLEDLRNQSEEINFQKWEKAWAVELYQLLSICYGRLAKASKGDLRKDFTLLYGKNRDILSRLDIRAAAIADTSL